MELCRLPTSLETILYAPLRSLLQFAGPRGRKQLRGTVTKYDPEHVKCRWYVVFDDETAAVYGTGEWGMLDESRTVWVTYRHRRPVMSLSMAESRVDVSAPHFCGTAAVGGDCTGRVSDGGSGPMEHDPPAGIAVESGPGAQGEAALGVALPAGNAAKIDEAADVGVGKLPSGAVCYGSWGPSCGLSAATADAADAAAGSASAAAPSDVVPADDELQGKLLGTTLDVRMDSRRRGGDVMFDVTVIA